MGNKLKAGNLSVSHNPVDPLFVNSMADAMEKALDKLMQDDQLPQLSFDAADPSVRDRRRLFVAIARGVVSHLAANKDAFILSINTPATVLMHEIKTE